MSEAALRAGGWVQTDDDGFVRLVGPFWQRQAGEALELAVATDERHRNRSGIVQGGLICTLADRALGAASRLLTNNRAQVTINLDVTFLGRIAIGDILIARPHIIRQSPSLNFGDVEIWVEDRLCAKAQGIFKLLDQR